MSSRSESPASGILQDRLLIEAEGHARAYGEDGFSQCEDVILHRGHVVVVLALIKRQQFLELLHLADFLGGTLNDHRLVSLLGADDAVGVALEIARLARAATSAEVEHSPVPQAPDDHQVRATVLPHGGEPIVVTALETLLCPAPRHESVGAFG